MQLSLVVLPLLGLLTLRLVVAQGSPLPCLLPSNTSYITYVGALLPPITGCPSYVEGPIYLIWPDLDHLITILLGNATSNGDWVDGPISLPEELPVYGFGWMLLRPGPYPPVQVTLEFASALSVPFAILKTPISARNSSGLVPGNIRLIEPTDVPFLCSGLYCPQWPLLDRVVLQLSPDASDSAQTVDLLLYTWTDPYPYVLLGENVPLPPPGDTLEYLINATFAQSFAVPAQLVVVSSVSALEDVLAVSPVFELIAQWVAPSLPFSTSITPPTSYDPEPTGTIVTLTGMDFSEGETVTALSSWVPASTWKPESSNSQPPASTIASNTPSLTSATGSTWSSLASQWGAFPLLGVGLLVLVVSTVLLL